MSFVSPDLPSECSGAPIRFLMVSRTPGVRVGQFKKKKSHISLRGFIMQSSPVLNEWLLTWIIDSLTDGSSNYLLCILQVTSSSEFSLTERLTV